MEFCLVIWVESYLTNNKIKTKFVLRREYYRKILETNKVKKHCNWKQSKMWCNWSYSIIIQKKVSSHQQKIKYMIKNDLFFKSIKRRNQNVHQYGWCVKQEDIYLNLSLCVINMISSPLSNARISCRNVQPIRRIAPDAAILFSDLGNSTSDGNWSIDETKFWSVT
jgi:hypothetical protein